MEKNIDSIAFQGVHGAYQELACFKYFPDYKTIPCKSFEDVFTKVKNSEVSLGMLPLENSYAGRVSEMHNLLLNTDLFITGEYFLQINHYLAGAPNSKIENIDTVISHPMALMQCTNNIQRQGFKTISDINTAVSAKELALRPDNKNGNIAVICSSLACELYNLEILYKNFQDSSDNYTHFITIAQEPADIAKDVPSIGTLLFELKNKSAALYHALGVFAKQSINITKIESYIPGGLSENAKFLLSFEGNPHNQTTELVLKELPAHCNSIKVLGFYPAANIRLKK